MKDGNIIQEIFENPALIEKLSMEKIDAWIAEAPYVQYLHLLKALKLKSQGVSDPKAYHKAATVVTDRIRMNELLDSLEGNNAEETVTSEKKEKGKKLKKKKSKKSNRLATKATNENIEEEVNNDSKEVGEYKATIKVNSEEESIAEEAITEEAITEESIEDWDDYITSYTSDSFIKKDENKAVSDSKEISLVQEGAASDEIDQPPNMTRSELSEFSEWLLALGGKNEDIDEEQVDQSVSIEGAAISVTLAKLMEKQGHILKAIEMYEKLSLTNPEKSAYFAALIEKLKKQ